MTPSTRYQENLLFHTKMLLMTLEIWSRKLTQARRRYPDAPRRTAEQVTEFQARNAGDLLRGKKIAALIAEKESPPGAGFSRAIPCGFLVITP